MERHDTRIENGTLFVEVDDEDLEIGEMDAICELLGETYTVQYGEDQRKMAWLDTDEDGTLTFDVRETLDDLDYNDAFVEKMAAEPIDRTSADGHPVRTEAFADLMSDLWDSKGDTVLE